MWEPETIVIITRRGLLVVTGITGDALVDQDDVAPRLLTDSFPEHSAGDHRRLARLPARPGFHPSNIEHYQPRLDLISSHQTRQLGSDIETRVRLTFCYWRCPAGCDTREE